MDRKQVIAIGIIGLMCSAGVFLMTRPSTPSIDQDMRAVETTVTSYLDHDTTIIVDGYTLQVETADQPEEKSQGLGDVSYLRDDEGMLFPFTDRPDSAPSFWMLGMIIPIDIIWIHDGTIVSIDKEAQPEPETPYHLMTHYRPDIPVDYVLEVRAGLSDEKGFDVGDVVVIQLAGQ